MSAKLIFAPEVEVDLSEAYSWYDQQRSGLGEEFLECVDLCVKSIVDSPDSYEIVQEGYHRALVKRFPYAVFYENNEHIVTVYCVFHTSRDPEKWKQRLS